MAASTMQVNEPQDARSKMRTLFEGFLASGAPPARQRPRARSEHSAPEPIAASDGGLYIISVAARILSMHPQTLRKYERVGLVQPSRTVGMLRLYSEEDIAKLRMIKYLVDEIRLNLAGVDMALAVFDLLAQARHEIHRAPSAAARTFERAYVEITELLQGRQA